MIFLFISHLVWPSAISRDSGIFCFRGPCRNQEQELRQPLPTASAHNPTSPVGADELVLTAPNRSGDLRAAGPPLSSEQLLHPSKSSTINWQREAIKHHRDILMLHQYCLTTQRGFQLIYFIIQQHTSGHISTSTLYPPGYNWISQPTTHWWPEPPGQGTNQLLQVTHNQHVATEHQAEVLGEGPHKIHQCRAEVGWASQHQALRSAGRGKRE